VQPMVKGFDFFDFWQSKTFSLVDQTPAICTSLASSVERFTLATSISVHLIDYSLAQLHHYFLLWTCLGFFCCCRKNAESLLCFDIAIHQERDSQLSMWIYIIYPSMAFIQTGARGLGKWSLLHYVIFSGF